MSWKFAGVFNTSIFGWQQECRRASIGFRDDPELHARAESVTGENSPIVLEAEFVLSHIIVIEFSPVASEMSLQKGERVLTAGLECH